MKKLHIITGQTATGKTAAALELASKVNGELVNFDSRQMYKNLDLVTGKDFVEKNFALVEKNEIGDIGYYTLNKHGTAIKLWLYDSVNPKQNVSSHDFQNLCIQVISDIWKRDRIPILVGGTYLYLYFLLYGSLEYQPPDWEFRKQMEGTSITDLQEMVQKKNTTALSEMNESDRNNPHRLIRFLERTSIESKMKFDLVLYQKVNLNSKELSITMEGFRHKNRENIKTILKSRVMKRIEEGAIQETEKLLSAGYTETDPGMKSIGYSQIIKYLKNQLSFDGMVEEWINKEYQYSKRQITFMIRDPNIVWREV